jgi:exopolysaccharide biosynthesis WecB/TagA/CpsF family protein
VATLDFFQVAARRAAAAGMSFYFLGSREDENQGAVAQVRAAYPDLRIAGRHLGYISRDEEAAIVEQIVAAKTDVLWVAMGVPNEHRFIVRNRARLAGVAWVKSCGGMFKFLAGKAPRAPQWMQALCLEWLHRLFHEPVRLFSRYFRTNGHAIYLMYKYRALTRGGPRGTPHPPALARGGEGRSSAVDGA